MNENTIVDTFRKNKIEGVKDKCLLLIPHRFAIGCESPKWVLRDDLTEKEKEYVINEMINAKR